MSAETDFRARLVAEASLTTLVGTRVVQNGITEESPLPYVVFTSTHDPQLGLMNNVLSDDVSFTVECWATSALQADAVADAVQAALAGFSGAAITSRASGFDAENGLDATVLSVDWWQ